MSANDAISVLRAVAPRANDAFVKASGNLGTIFRDYGISTPNAQAMVIAQCAHESGGFRRFEENLNYSAKRLTEVWPSRFPTLAAAAPCANNPKALANRVYNGRMGNRAGTDDGWNYRGSNILQHTGASEFDRVGRRTGMPVKDHPDMLRDAANAQAGWRAACSYFADRGAITPANSGDVRAVTLKINGGTTGLADREVLYRRALAALAGQPVPAVKTTVEQADDSKRRAQQAVASAPAAGGVSGAGGKQSGLEPGQAIAVGLIGLFAVLIVAGIFWRVHRAKKDIVERAQVKTIEARIALAAD